MADFTLTPQQFQNAIARWEPQRIGKTKLIKNGILYELGSFGNYNNGIEFINILDDCDD